MDTRTAEPSPENFDSYDAAAEFWDERDTTDYLDEFRTVEMKADLRARRYEIEVDESVAKALQAAARDRGVRTSELATSLLRRQLGIAA